MNLACLRVQVGRSVLVVGLMVLLSSIWGCKTPKVSTAEQLAAFERAGPVRPKVDRGQLTTARMPAGPYRAVVGDVLSLDMPAVMRAAADELPQSNQPYLCRVTRSGKISLPIVGELQAAEKTLDQIEGDIAATYYPRYVKSLPSVVVRVAEYRTASVSVVGAVASPGVYRLRSDEMSLVNLIMQAGGVVQGGAALIRISGGRLKPEEPLVLPVKGLNIPFADVALYGGEAVEVEQLDPQVFMVTGLVNRPGPFPYPPGISYSVSQALAFAGGVDDQTDPQYTHIYRQDAEGRLLIAILKITDEGRIDTSRFKIKPGDIVAVEHTQRTRWRQTMANAFRISTGMVVGATYDLNSSDGD